MKWLACGTEFIAADVIRWREPVWKPQPSTSKKKPAVIGQRCVTGQILRIDRNGWVHIKIAACTMEPSPHWPHPLPPLKRGEIIRRQRSKIGQAKPGSGKPAACKIDRLPWSDETARAAVTGSRFVKA